MEDNDSDNCNEKIVKGSSSSKKRNIKTNDRAS